MLFIPVLVSAVGVVSFNSCGGRALRIQKNKHARESLGILHRAGAVMRACTSTPFTDVARVRFPYLLIVRCGLCLLVHLSAPRHFSPGTPVFLYPQIPMFDLI